MRLIRAVALALFACAPTLSLAVEPTPGVTAHEIVVGTISDLSGPIALLGVPVRDGMLMRFEEANAAGGVHGRRIRLAVEDAGYDPKRETVVLDVLDENFDAEALRSALLGVRGVTEVDASAAGRRASVSFPAGAVDTRLLRTAAQAAGIDVKERADALDREAQDHAVSEREQRLLMYKWATAGIAGALMQGHT